MNYLKCAIVCTALQALSVPAIAAPQQASLELRTGQEIETFSQTPDGNWHTTIRQSDGSEADYVFEPGTKLTPSIRSSVAVANARLSTMLYTWQLVNDSISLQQLARITAMRLPVTSVLSAPLGWSTFSQGGSLMMFGPIEGTSDIPSGVPPGGHESLRFDGVGYLPGPVAVSAMGNVLAELRTPPAMTGRQLADLLRISEHPTGPILAIGPSIPAGLAEPELTRAVLVARVAGDYLPALMVAKHPFAGEFSTAFAGIRDTPGTDVEVHLREIMDITRRAVHEPWHQELSSALGICIDLLLSGDVPVRQ